MADVQSVDFRPLVEADLALMHRWLNEPGVVRWWESEDVSRDAVVRDYGPDRTDSNEHWIAEIGAEPIGWIQCWPVLGGLEESELWFDFGVERTAAGIDYLIGEPGQRGRGLGSAMIRAFVFDVVFSRHRDWTQAAASPYSANAASVRALAKAGFAEAGIITYPDDELPCTLMVLDRPQTT